MGRISFFTMLASDMTFWEADAINSAHDRAETALTAAGNLGEAVSRIHRRLIEQDKQIKLLNAAVGVLAAVLRDNGALNGELLDARLEAAMLNAEEEIATTANTFTCLKCGRQLPKAQSVMTEVGVVCDRCHAIG